MFGIDGIEDLIPGEDPSDDEIITDIADTEGPGDSEISPELADLETPGHEEIVPDEVDSPPEEVPTTEPAEDVIPAEAPYTDSPEVNPPSGNE